MTTQNLVHGREVDHWDKAIYAFLAEKERRMKIAPHLRRIHPTTGMLRLSPAAI